MGEILLMCIVSSEGSDQKDINPGHQGGVKTRDHPDKNGRTSTIEERSSTAKESDKRLFSHQGRRCTEPTRLLPR